MFHSKVLNLPSTDMIYGYLYLNKKVDDKMHIFSEFHTINEVWEDLNLFDKSLWTVSENNNSGPGDVVYQIRGHGFLKKVGK